MPDTPDMAHRIRWIVPFALVACLLLVLSTAAGPEHARADPGISLTEPIPPMDDAKRNAGSIRQQIGWEHAYARLGRLIPTGRGIAGGLVEAGESYAPGEIRGTTFILQSGESGVSGHATQSASLGFGPESPAPGVARVHCYSTQDWMTKGYLKTGSTDNPDDWTEARVFTHSWIAAKSGATPRLLRRVDYAIDEYDVIMAVGLNNGVTEMPDLLASAYNVISVGRSDGQHSQGGTKVEGEGRSKPEITAPGNLTSKTTPIVAGCAAALLQQADAMAEGDPDGPGKDSAKSEVIKSLLLGGAWKSPAWQKDARHGLDKILGAGQVDIDRSFVMQAGGPVEPGDQRQRYAWAYQQITSGKTQSYSFDIDTDQGQACFTLVWNRKVVGGEVTLDHPETGQPITLWNNSTALANLDLKLIAIDPFGQESVKQSSTSQADNVEMVYLRDLPAGKYRLEVSRAADAIRINWPYALAWRIEAPGQ